MCDIAPRLDYERYALVASIWGTESELVRMTKLLNGKPFKAIELNVSCPNTGHGSVTQQITRAVEAVRSVSKHPLILKVSADQDLAKIAEGVCGLVEAFSLNSVPWDKVFPGRTSPVEKIGKPGTGKGGVSGRAAQKANWEAVGILARYGHGIPVIAPSVMNYDDVINVRMLGAKAVSFGAIHLRTPWEPTQIVEHERRLRSSMYKFEEGPPAA